jgi:hypothetical protein
VIILHDQSHVRYGFEPNPAYPQERLTAVSRSGLTPLKMLTYANITDRLTELFGVCQPHPQGEYTVILELTHSPQAILVALLHGLRTTPHVPNLEARVLVQISQFVQMYPIQEGEGWSKGIVRWKGSTFRNDVRILARKILQEFLLDLEARRIWQLRNPLLGHQPLPDFVTRKYRPESLLHRPGVLDLTSETQVELVDLTQS